MAVKTRSLLNSGYDGEDMMRASGDLIDQLFAYWPGSGREDSRAFLNLGLVDVKEPGFGQLQKSFVWMHSAHQGAQVSGRSEVRTAEHGSKARILGSGSEALVTVRQVLRV